MNRISPHIWLYVFTVMFLPMAILLANEVITETDGYTKEKTAYVETLNFENRILTPNEWIHAVPNMSALDNIVVTSKENDIEEKKKAAQTHLTASKEHYQSAIEKGKLLVVMAIMYLMLVFTLFYKKKGMASGMGIAMVITSFVLLGVGIFCPMLEIGAFNTDLTIPVDIGFEIPLVGDVGIDYDMVFEDRVYYYYQSKSIAELIKILFVSENYVVGVAILLFSVAIPLFKLMLTLIVLMAGERALKWNVVNIIKAIGKWSMADVFVAASFLAFLSFYNMNAGQVEMETLTLIGLYFFLGYCILSILSSYALKQQTEKMTMEDLL